MKLCKHCSLTETHWDVTAYQLNEFTCLGKVRTFTFRHSNWQRVSF